MKILHVISGLNQGGAESVLYSLVSSSSSKCNHTIVSMMDEGVYGARLQGCGATVHTLGMSRGRMPIRGLYRLYRIIRQVKPDVVQTWMYHADFFGGIMAKLAGVKSVVWGIHSTHLDLNVRSLPTVILSLINGLLSRWLPSAIVCCSNKAVQAHQSKWYLADRFVVIPNGYNLSVLLPNTDIAKTFRQKLGVSLNEKVLGSIARWHPMKDHKNLFDSLAILNKEGVFLRCVLVGEGMTGNNDELQRLIERCGVVSNMILVGPRDDIPTVMNSIDINVLSSYVEAFPNVVAEAMACGTPCVVTDVGDTALIVGDAGWVVPSRDPGELAKGIKEALSVLERDGKESVGLMCRDRIAKKFSVEIMVDNYISLWGKVTV